MIAQKAAALSLITQLLASSASADMADDCFFAPVQAQALRRAGKLLEARDRFAQCARDACPAEIAGQCGQWVDSIERALPRIVILAQDGEGKALEGARISIDGAPSVDAGDTPIPVAAGAHTILIEREGYASVTRSVSAREAETREVVATLRRREAAAERSGRALLATQLSLAGPTSPPSEEHGGVAPLPLLLGGVGLLGLANAAVFGTWGLVSRSQDACDTGCTPGLAEDVHMKLVIADVSLAAGVASLGTAICLHFALRSSGSPRAAFLEVRPQAGGAAAVFDGQF